MIALDLKSMRRSEMHSDQIVVLICRGTVTVQPSAEQQQCTEML